MARKTFTRKNGGGNPTKLYTWSPIKNDKKRKGKGQVDKFFCSATPNSQGEDWRVTYVYTITVVDGVQHRIAYVACDYVK